MNASRGNTRSTPGFILPEYPPVTNALRYKYSGERALMETRAETGFRSPDESRNYPHTQQSTEQPKLVEDLEAYFRRYARERPQTVALACLAVGFVLGWKLKPW